MTVTAAGLRHKNVSTCMQRGPTTLSSLSKIHSSGIYATSRVRTGTANGCHSEFALLTERPVGVKPHEWPTDRTHGGAIVP